VAAEELLALHRQAAAFYRDRLAGSWVPAYLERRSLAGALEDSWLVGYAPRGWTALVDHLRGAGADEAALLTSGLATRARTGSLIDRFRDRLVLPLRTPAGDIVGFIGRSHPDADRDRTPRYLNSPDTPIYTKGEHLHGLHEAAPHLARGARPVLVEGPLDAIAVTTGTGGRCTGVALWGTALTTRHLDALAEVVDVRRTGLVVATDPDRAGLTAAARALTLLGIRNLSASAAGLRAGEDPADTLHRRGPAALTSALLDRAVPLADIVIDHRIDRWNDRLHTVEGRVGALRDVAPLVASLPIDEIRRQGPRLAQRLDLVPGVVHQEITARIDLEPPIDRLEKHQEIPRPGCPTGAAQAFATNHRVCGTPGRRR
jgi:DNA primase catalytic core